LMGLSFESYEIWEHGDVAVGIILDSNISCSMPKIEVMGELYIIENCDTYPEGIELPVVSLPKSYDRVYVGEKGESPIAFILNRGSWVYFFWGLILIFIGSMIQFYAKKHFQHQS
jgi:hypothetical protein